MLTVSRLFTLIRRSVNLIYGGIVYYEDSINRAIDLIADGEEQTGQELLQETIDNIKSDIDAGSPGIHHYLAWGVALEVLEEYEQAILKYEKILQWEPENKQALYKIISVTYECLNNPETARTLLEKRLIPLDPENREYAELSGQLKQLIESRRARAAADEDKPKEK